MSDMSNYVARICIVEEYITPIIYVVQNQQSSP